MKEIDSQKYEQAVNDVQVMPPAHIDIHPVGALAIITLIQAAIIADPGMANHEWAKIAIAAGRKLQEDLFDQSSIVYDLLETGWKIQADAAIETLTALQVPESAAYVPSDQM